MTDRFEDPGLDSVPRQAAEAAAALEALREPAERAAASIETAFGKAGESLARSLARAASDGEISLAELARAVLAAVNAIGAGGGSGSLGDAIAAVLSGVFGAVTREVATYHHQGVADPGSLRIAAHAPDGLIEALEDPSRPFVVGVQWHPEALNDQELFGHFVSHATARARV